MKVAHVTSVHSAMDVRISYKEARSLAQAGYDATITDPGEPSRHSDSVTIRAVPLPDGRLDRLSWPHDHRTGVFAQFTVLADNSASLQAWLHAAGIPSAVHYPVPLSEQPAGELCKGDFTPAAQSAAARVLGLPMGPDLFEADQRRVAAGLAA